MSSVSDAKRKRLAALEERQKKPGPGQGQKGPSADGGQHPAYASPGAHTRAEETPEPKATLPDPSAFLESFLSGLLKGNVSRPGEIIETRVRDKVVLLDNPTIGKSRRDRDARTRAVRSLKHMSLREHRRNGSFYIPPELQRLELYEPLHVLWLEYIEKLTQGCSGQALLTRLLTADYHGASLSVTASKDPTYCGTEGLVVRETQNTFQMVTAENKLRVVPKRGSIFQLKLRDSLVSLFGNRLVEERSFTPIGRRTPKFKNVLPTIEL